MSSAEVYWLHARSMAGEMIEHHVLICGAITWLCTGRSRANQMGGVFSGHWKSVRCENVTHDQVSSAWCELNCSIPFISGFSYGRFRQMPTDLKVWVWRPAWKRCSLPFKQSRLILLSFVPRSSDHPVKSKLIAFCPRGKSQDPNKSKVKRVITNTASWTDGVMIGRFLLAGTRRADDNRRAAASGWKAA